jgi:hypothetical protein
LLAWHRKLIAGSTTELPIVHRVGHVPRTRSRLWWCEWHKRIGTGAIGESRVRYPILDTNILTIQHDGQQPVRRRGEDAGAKGIVTEMECRFLECL